jgi:hypothetical protein
VTQMNFMQFVNPSKTLIAISIAFGLTALYFCIFDFSLSFVHPHRYEVHLPIMLGDHVGFALDDLLKPFLEFAPGEHRPRFLTYALILFDLRLRMIAYDYLILPPGTSIAWILQLFVAPYFLFRLVRNISGNISASMASVAVYISSVGFLSGFSMYFTPGKPLSNVIFIAVLYWMSEINRQLRDGELYWDSKLREKWWIGLSLLLGLLLDEMPLFAVALAPLCFPHRFLSNSVSRKIQLRNIIFYLQPVWCFLIISLFIAPLITSYALNYRFDYFSSLFGIGSGAAGAKSFYEGPYGKFGFLNLFQNFSTLIVSSLLPDQISALTKHPSAGGVISAQSNGWLQILVLMLFSVGLWKLSRKPFLVSRAFFPKMLVSSVLFVVFISLLSGRHVPFITGYYYGCAWSILFSICIGLSFDAISLSGRLAKLLASIVILWIAMVQINNFLVINHSYISVHNDGMARFSYKDKFNLSDADKITVTEADFIWKAWKQDQLQEYLNGNTVSTSSLFLIVELDWLHKISQSHLHATKLAR